MNSQEAMDDLAELTRRLGAQEVLWSLPVLIFSEEDGTWLIESGDRAIIGATESHLHFLNKTGETVVERSRPLSAITQVRTLHVPLTGEFGLPGVAIEGAEVAWLAVPSGEGAVERLSASIAQGCPQLSEEQVIEVPMDIVLESATTSADLVGTDAFLKVLRYSITLIGEEIASQLELSDPIGLYAPLDVVADGKRRLGAILATGDRAVIGWRHGTFRARSFAKVIPYRDIESVAIGALPPSALSVALQTLTIQSQGETWQLVFANLFEGGHNIVPILRDRLAQSIEEAR